MLCPPRSQSLRPSIVTPREARWASQRASSSLPMANATCSTPCPPMPWNRAARQNDSLRRRALEKDQEDIAPRHGIASQTVVAVDRLEPQHVFVEGPRPRHVLGVDRGFQDAIELRHDASNRLGIAADKSQ